MTKALLKFLIYLSCIYGSSSYAIKQQESPSWCWAASIQEVIRLCRNISVPQEHIVQTLTGTIDYEAMASAADIIATLHAYGLRGSIDKYLEHKQIKSLLSTGNWLVIGTNAAIDNKNDHHWQILSGVDETSQNYRVANPSTGEIYPTALEQLHREWNWKDTIIVHPYEATLYLELPIERLYGHRDGLYYRSYCPFYQCHHVPDSARHVFSFLQALDPFAFMTFLTYAQQLATHFHQSISLNDPPAKDIIATIRQHLLYHYQHHVQRFPPLLSFYQSLILNLKTEFQDVIRQPIIYSSLAHYFSPHYSHNR